MTATETPAAENDAPAPAFTPGPYRIQRDSEGVDEYWIIRAAADDAYVASVWFWPDTLEECGRAYANARLLQSAPTLLSLVKALAETRPGADSHAALAKRARRLVRRLERGE